MAICETIEGIDPSLCAVSRPACWWPWSRKLFVGYLWEYFLFYLDLGGCSRVDIIILRHNFEDIVDMCATVAQDTNIKGVLIFCRSGKHRSVAYARFLIRVLQDLGIGITQRHYCDYLWLNTECMRSIRPARCVACFGQRPEAFERAMVTLLDAVKAHMAAHR